MLRSLFCKGWLGHECSLGFPCNPRRGGVHWHLPVGCPFGFQQICRSVGYPNQFLGDSQCCLFFFLMSGNLICFIMQSIYIFNWYSETVDFSSFLIFLFYLFSFIFIILIFIYILLVFPNFDFSESLSHWLLFSLLIYQYLIIVENKFHVADTEPLIINNASKASIGRTSE